MIRPSVKGYVAQCSVPGLRNTTDHNIAEASGAKTTHRIATDIGVAVPTTWISGIRAAAKRVRSQKPSVPCGVVSILGVVQPGFGIPRVGGELFLAVGERSGAAVLTVGEELADGTEAILVDPAAGVLEHLAAEVFVTSD
ncbi:MAG: hypothetical protein ABI811_19870 [Acidobacteriota bacterium]